MEVTKPVRERDKIKSSVSSAPPYEPSPRELEIVKTQLDRRENKKPAPRVKVTTAKNVAVTSTDHPDKVVGEALLMEALGTSEPDFLKGLLGQLINAGTQGRTVDENTLNFMLAIVKGVEPRDQGEALLAAQMAAVHNATMTFVRRLCCKLAEGAKCDQGLPVHVMILRWPDGPVATPWPRSGRTVRDRRRARRSGPRRQCRPAGRTSQPGPCAARASPRSP